MMQIDQQNASPSSTAHFDFDIPGPESAHFVFDFDTITVPPSMGLTFSPREPPRRGNKRSRSIADVDGDHSCLQKKKRRLRLFLITSRLSPQFSHPATNIVDRGSSKIAVWAKQKALGRNLLRKAAILNRIRRTTTSPRAIYVRQDISPIDQEREQEQFELARLEFRHGAVDTYTRPVLSRTPAVPPSAAVRTGGHFVVSGSPSSSPISSRSPSPTPTSPPSKSISGPCTEYRSPNEAYAYSPPRAQKPRRDFVPLPPSPLALFSNYEALDGDEDIHGSYDRFDDDDEPTPSRYDDLDEDEHPLVPTTITESSSVPTHSSITQYLDRPSPIHYSSFSLLEGSQSVFGDYDQDDGAEAVWPSTFAKRAASISRLDEGTSTQDLPSVPATSSSPKRNDSFATASRPTSISSNLTTPTAAAPASPNFTATSHSPNFGPSDAPYLAKTKYKGPQERRKEEEMKEERVRQRDLLFMRFG